MSHDVIVVGGGAAGSVAAAVLAKEGKRVLLLERDAGLAGRARYFDVEGYKLQWGPHLLEDPGSGLTAIMDWLGYELEHGETNDGMAIWTGDAWKSASEVYGSGREDLKRLSAEIASLDLDSLDALDQVSLRHWLAERTSHEGVMGLFEFMAVLEGQTGGPQDHSASDNLFMRSLHLRERRKPGYSYVPRGGFDELFETVGAIAEDHGAQVRRNVEVASVAIEDGKVRGVYVEQGTRRMPNEFLPVELLEADEVILTLPVFQVLDILPLDEIPDWYLELITRLTTEDARGSWIGFYAALEEPAHQFTERELAAWFTTPRTGYPGFGYLHSALDPGTAPEGEHLFVCGIACDLEAVKDRTTLAKLMADFEADMDDMYPALKGAKWKVRHVIENFGLKARPGLVGALRPSNTVPGVEGLYCGGDTFQSRSVGIDRAARSGLTCAELVLGRRVDGLSGTWRY
ncbi:MAG: phytoene desaturase family protein [Microthrixaceae bacterium]